MTEKVIEHTVFVKDISKDQDGLLAVLLDESPSVDSLMSLEGMFHPEVIKCVKDLWDLANIEDESVVHLRETSPFAAHLPSSWPIEMVAITCVLRFELMAVIRELFKDWGAPDSRSHIAFTNVVKSLTCIAWGGRVGEDGTLSQSSGPECLGGEDGSAWSEIMKQCISGERVVH